MATEHELAYLEGIAAVLLDCEPLTVERTHSVQTTGGSILHVSSTIHQDGMNIAESTMVGIARYDVSDELFEAVFDENDQMTRIGLVCEGELDETVEALRDLLDHPELDPEEQALLVFLEEHIREERGEPAWDEEVQTNPPELIRKLVDEKTESTTFEKEHGTPIDEQQSVFIMQVDTVTDDGLVELTDDFLRIDVCNRETGVSYVYRNHDGTQCLQRYATGTVADLKGSLSQASEGEEQEVSVSDELDHTPAQQDVLLMSEVLQRALILRNNTQ